MTRKPVCFSVTRYAVFILVVASALAHSGEALSFGFDDVDQRARKLAASAYVKPPAVLPKELRVSYDEYRDFRYRRERFLWTGKLPFEVAFFHPGFLYEHPVRIHEVAAGKVAEIRFDPSAFDYGKQRIDPERLIGLGGFAGFRVHYPMNNPKYKDEVLAFLGASYFRAIGKWQLYGLSARGLALDTAVAAGEEFPRFSEFWLERPAANATQLTIYALLDSRRATGAYRFVVKPGVETVIDVKARLYLREKVAKVGIAPLTTMFFFGENQRPPREDFRPEVHDSDGLSIQTADGEWLWRPLVNPKRLLVTSFALNGVRGFGLMQRDRDFARYEDLEARYELRPSAWVEPKGAWGRGRVELVQIPSPDETNDNVVAFWVPETTPAPQEPLDLEYRLRWQKDTAVHPPHAWVVQSRRGLGGNVRKQDASVGFQVDYVGPALRKLPADTKVEAVVSTDANAQLLEREAYPNHVSGGWRLALRLKRLDEAKPVELRAFLRHGGEAISEVWSYVLPAN